MTAHTLLTALLPLISDLSRDLQEGERYRRLLQAMRAVLPCDAAALLRLDDQWLVPLAVDGLSPDTLGRRFKVADHPRFETLLTNSEPTRFASDSPLPDPYDGLVEGHSGVLEVHDCLGCPLLVDDKPWGLLTLDALDPQRFDGIEPAMLTAFASLAAATVTVAQRIERLALRAELYQQVSRQDEQTMIGQSTAFKRLMDEVDLVGKSELTVLITGETGVGKELIAQALHRASTRSDKPLVILNCAALPETLVESELFGHVRGAFTGAVSDRRGKFELANGGTLFLDEVGELPLMTQAKLLRVLQSGQIQRLGSDKEHRVEVRLIAATNRDLAGEVREGRYRADFYHRLSVYPLRVPSLRERGHDVLLISGYFLEQNRSRLGLGSLRLSADAQAALLAYDWPGNVRELEHLVGRSVLKVLGRHPNHPARAERVLTLTAQDLDLPLENQAPAAEPRTAVAYPLYSDLQLRQATDAFQRQLIETTLERHAGQWASAARELAVDRANLARLARRLGVKPERSAKESRPKADKPG